MITGSIKSQIDQIWNAFWSGGISNPLEVIEQIKTACISNQPDVRNSQSYISRCR
jgi:hypothetical protein